MTSVIEFCYKGFSQSNINWYQSLTGDRVISSHLFPQFFWLVFVTQPSCSAPGSIKLKTDKIQH